MGDGDGGFLSHDFHHVTLRLREGAVRGGRHLPLKLQFYVNRPFYEGDEEQFGADRLMRDASSYTYAWVYRHPALVMACDALEQALLIYGAQTEQSFVPIHKAQDLAPYWAPELPLLEKAQHIHGGWLAGMMESRYGNPDLRGYVPEGGGRRVRQLLKDLLTGHEAQPPITETFTR